MDPHHQENNSDSLYLQQLQFKKEDEKTWLNFFIKNFRVTVLIIIGLLVWGGISLQSLPLESTPEVTIPVGIVSVGLPGASPSDIEELIVRKIESRVGNLSGVKQITSTSSHSFGVISVEFRAEEDIKDSIRRLRDSVESVKAELPIDATDPQVSEVSFSDSPVWTFVISGPYDGFTLRKFAETVQNEIEKLPETKEVTINGGDTTELRVFFDPNKLESHNLTIDQVNGAIRANNITIPLGTVEVSNFEYNIRVNEKFTNALDLSQIPITIENDRVIRLEDVASVQEIAKKRNIENLFSVNGDAPYEAVTLNVIKKTGTSIITLIDSGKEKIENLKKSEFPQDLNIETTLDQSTTIRRDVNQLLHDGILTVLLVFIILFLFVGLKEAFVAGLAVPLVFCATFGIMLLTGISLNFLSIFSLILSLGLLVDDAIVVVQATKQYLKTGKFTPEEAVLLVFHDYKVLLTTTTLTTIWAFIPLLLATGIIGQFIRSIPITVSVTLAASYAIAIIINHPMAIILERFRLVRIHFKVITLLSSLALIGSVVLLALEKISQTQGIIIIGVCGYIFISLISAYRKRLKVQLQRNEDLLLIELADPQKIKEKIRHHYGDGNQERSFWSRIINGVIKLESFLNGYGSLLKRILSSRAKSWILLIFSGIAFFISIIFPATGMLKSEFISADDAEYMYINIEGPQGLVLDKTKIVAEEVQNILLKEEAIKNFSFVVGASGVNLDTGASNPGSGNGGQSNRSQFALNLFPKKERPISKASGKIEKSYEFAQRLRKLIAPIQGAKINVVEVSGGPPSGADFEAKILGTDLITLENTVNDLKEILSKIPGTVNIQTSIKLSPGEFTLELNTEEMQLKGVNAAQLATTLRAALTGTEITKILRDDKEITVRTELDESEKLDISRIESLILSNGRGENFRLGEVASVRLDPAITSISRIDQKRAVVLSAGVEKPRLPAEVLKEFQELIQKNPLPEGYEIIYGGQNDTNTESILSILRAMILAMILIVGTLVIQFNSFRKSILVLATIPLALTGVFLGLTIFGFTLSFPSLIGILALFGIVVKNAVILVDKVNLNLKVGIPFIDAIVDASKSRLEAILLTSICTIVGMIPLTVSNPTWQGLGLALIFGLITSTFLTLFIIPVLFNILIRKSNMREERLRALKNHVAGGGHF